MLVCPYQLIRRPNPFTIGWKYIRCKNLIKEPTRRLIDNKIRKYKVKGSTYHFCTIIFTPRLHWIKRVSNNPSLQFFKILPTVCSTEQSAINRRFFPIHRCETCFLYFIIASKDRFLHLLIDLLISRYTIFGTQPRKVLISFPHSAVLSKNITIDISTSRTDRWVLQENSGYEERILRKSQFCKPNMVFIQKFFSVNISPNKCWVTTRC